VLFVAFESGKIDFRDSSGLSGLAGNLPFVGIAADGKELAFGKGILQRFCGFAKGNNGVPVVAPSG
jgi:hypothetical protein